MQLSIVLPTFKGAHLIHYGLNSLGRQSFRDFELIIVVKPSGDGTEKKSREICRDLHIQHRILTQEEGYFTHALNMGIKHARGEIILFTDDDAFFPKDWVENHINAHMRFRDSGAVCGHSIPYPFTMSSSGAFFVARRKILQELRRGWQFVKPILNKSHVLFKKYRLGMYITQGFRVRAGPAIPYKLCFSLPVQGVNMSFKREAVGNLLFLEHPLLKTAPNNEHYFAAQLLLRGWDSIYDPYIHVQHITRMGISESPRNKIERELMRAMLKKLLMEQE